MALDLTKFNSGVANLKLGGATGAIPATPKISGSVSGAAGTPPVVSQGTPTKSGGWSDIIPAVGGTLGAVGGSILGSVAEPVGGTIAGGVLGGAGGQALGEWIKELINRQPVSAGNIAKQGAIGGVFGSIPGGEEGGVLAKVGTRALVGGLTGATTKGIEEAGTADDFTTRLKNMATSGGIGALTFPAFGSALDLGTSALKFLGQKIPDDLIDSAVKKPLDTAKAIYQSIQGMLVGHNNVDYAVENGILPKETAITTDVINNSLQKAKDKSADIEKQLQEKLASSDVKIPLRDTANPQNSVYNIIDSVRTQVQSSVRGNQLYNSLFNVIPKDEAQSGVLSLSTVNEMKRVLGDVYNVSGIPDIYNKLQTLIENSAPEAKDLNQQALKLINMKNFLKDWQGKGAIPENLTPAGIQKAVADAGNGSPKSLQALLNTIALGGYMTIGALTKSVSQIGLSVGEVFGLRHVLNKIGEAITENPETKIKFADMLQGMYEGATKAQDKADILGFMRQVGIRLPQITGSILPKSKTKPIKR